MRKSKRELRVTIDPKTASCDVQYEGEGLDYLTMVCAVIDVLAKSTNASATTTMGVIVKYYNEVFTKARYAAINVGAIADAKEAGT